MNEQKTMLIKNNLISRLDAIYNSVIDICDIADEDIYSTLFYELYEELRNDILDYCEEE